MLEATALLYGAKKTVYAPVREEILIGPSQGSHLDPQKLNLLLSKASESRVKLASLKALYGNFKMQHYADHRAVVLFPYAVHSYGISEFYANGIPMFVPTIDFLIELNCMDDWKLLVGKFYCPGGYNPPKHPNSTHQFDPESLAIDSQRYWLQFADFYRWPFITYFSSFDELFLKLRTVNMREVHENMTEWNSYRFDKAQSLYKMIIQNVQRSRQVPSQYESALEEVWGLTPGVMLKEG